MVERLNKTEIFENNFIHIRSLHQKVQFEIWEKFDVFLFFLELISIFLGYVFSIKMNFKLIWQCCHLAAHKFIF